MIRYLAALVLASAPAPLFAQARQCRVPDTLPTPAPEGPRANEPRRLMAITNYTLALSWQPEFCRFRGDRAKDAAQCGADAERRGFVLHGLWPNGADRWPQYCHGVGLLPQAVLRASFCATPSVQLLQHEWAKHGSCVQTDPARYFRASIRMYRSVRYPDMDALSRAKTSRGDFAEAFAAANPGLTADMIDIRANRRGWLQEVWICFARGLKPAPCPRPMSSAERRSPLSIWRGAARGG